MAVVLIGSISASHADGAGSSPAGHSPPHYQKRADASTPAWRRDDRQLPTHLRTRLEDTWRQAAFTFSGGAVQATFEYVDISEVVRAVPVDSATPPLPRDASILRLHHRRRQDQPRSFLRRHHRRVMGGPAPASDFSFFSGFASSPGKATAGTRFPAGG